MNMRNWEALVKFMYRGHREGVQIRGGMEVDIIRTESGPFTTNEEARQYVLDKAAEGDEYYKRLARWLVKLKLGIDEPLQL